jgi:hypothetical protein
MAMPLTHNPASSTLCVDPAFESNKVPVAWHPPLLHTRRPNAGKHVRRALALLLLFMQICLAILMSLFISVVCRNTYKSCMMGKHNVK